MPFPSTLSSFTDPTPSDKLSTTPHSSIETAQNTGLRELQAFIGSQSSLVGTLYYDIRGAGSNGGGHVQTANKGGTGQTAYTKGDILVATSSSVLTKLAVSANDNDFLAINSSVAAGVNWTAGVTSGQVQNMAFSNATDTGTGSVYSISPVPCVLSYAAGQIFTFQAKTANTIAAPAINVSSLVSKLIKNPDGTALAVGQIAASAMTMVQYQGNASVFHLISQKNAKASGLRIGQFTTDVNVTNTITETTLFTFTLTGGDMGANDILHVHINGNSWNTQGGGTVNLQCYFGATAIDLWNWTGSAFTGVPGYIDFYIYNANATNSQVLTAYMYAAAASTGGGGVAQTAVHNIVTGTASIDTTANVTVKVTFKASVADPATNINMIDGYAQLIR